LSKDSRLDRSPMHLLHRAAQCVDDLFSKEVKPGLTPRQWALLTTISSNEGCNQAELVVLTGIDRSTIAELMKRLIKRRLVGRRRSEKDTRAYIIGLTDEGRRVLRSAEPLARRVDEKVLHALGNRSSAFLDNLNLLATRLVVKG
jgi:DNA-binding MarR family transcriptional regulator